MTGRMRQKERLVSTGRLRYWEGGATDSPAVLLLHSAYGDAEFSFRPVWEELAVRCRVIAPDMPGFGASEAPRGMDLPTLARALRELLGQLGVPRATVVGNSFGVSAAIGLADFHAEVVERLVLVNGTTLPTFPALLRRAVALPVLGRVISATFYRSIYGPKAIRSAFPHASPEALAGILSRVGRAGPANFRTMKSCILETPVKKPSIAAPATLLWGVDDGFTPLEVAHRLSKTLPGATLIEIQRAGHLPQWDRPAEFLERLWGATDESV
ncbi:MAG TPA: alpha/beta hydrolase [Polyangiaceae bacterium]|nr:alpha/beta hydrolase [Polyangiaceae bacterium]